MDDETALETPENPTATRRQWIRTAGGLLLAAGGLVLPAWIEAAEASEGANGGDLGGRHGKNTRGRHRRRTHGDHKQQGNGSGAPGAFVRGVRWGIYSRVRSFDVELWDRGDGFNGCRVVESQHVTPDNFVEMRVNKDIYGALWVNGRYYLSGFNGLGTPTVTLGYGGTFDSNGWNNGTTVVNSYALQEGKVAPAMDVDGIHFQVERISDDDDYKRFSLDLT